MSPKSVSLGKKFRANTLGYGYSQIATLAVQLALVPFFLSIWGKELYADWLVITGIPTFLALLDLGIAQSSANRATMLAASDNWNGARRSLQTAAVSSLCVGGIIILIVFSLTSLINIPSHLNLKSISDIEAEKILLVISTGLSVHLLTGPVDAWFRVIDRAATGAFLLANRRIVDVIVSIAVLLSGGGPLQLAVTLLIFQVISLIACINIAKKISAEKVLGISEASWSEWKLTIKPALAYTAFPISQALTLQGGVQVLNQIGNADTIVAFTMARTLMRLVLQVGVVCNNALKPMLSRLYGAGGNLSAVNFTLKVSLISTSLACALYIAFVLFGPQIILIWGMSKITVSSSQLAIVGAHALINVMWFVPAAYLIAKNDHSRIALIYGISTIVTFSIWILFKQEIPAFIGASLLLLIPEASALTYLSVAVIGLIKKDKADNK